ncbi:hypothetical protein [Kutzneria sp. NPDC051319]|uniref:hypothetical protein n=1 Tax=Kutzneria sp. NPDC051319 TaxID=3155047 RepID=UPI00343DF92D
MFDYHLIFDHDDETRTPFAVARGNMVFDHGLMWRRSDVLARLGNIGRGTCTRKVRKPQAAIEQITADVRRADQAAWIGKTYRYYASGDEVVRGRLVGPRTVSYERFNGLHWVLGEAVFGAVAEVDVEDAEEFKAARAAQPVAPEPEPAAPAHAPIDLTPGHYIITEPGDDQPLAIVRTGERERVQPLRAFRGYDSDFPVLSQLAAGRFDWTAHPVTEKEHDAARTTMYRADERASNSRWIHQPYRYYFVLNDERRKDTVTSLVRIERHGAFGGWREQRLRWDGTWNHSTKLMDADHGGYDDYREVTEADARRYAAGCYRR